MTGLVCLIMHFALGEAARYRDFPIEAELSVVSSGRMKDILVGNFAPKVKIPIVGYSGEGEDISQFGRMVQRASAHDRWGISEPVRLHSSR